MKKRSDSVDMVIFGAGPAGLAAASLGLYNGRNILVIEAGKQCNARDFNRPNDLATGVGGAGLYSDGKLSFFPSATELWQLGDNKSLKNAYNCGRRFEERMNWAV